MDLNYLKLQVDKCYLTLEYTALFWSNYYRATMTYLLTSYIIYTVYIHKSITLDNIFSKKKK